MSDADPPALNRALDGVSGEKLVDVLLAMRAACVTQLIEVKKDEGGWLKVFIAFYGAMIYWLLAILMKDSPAGGHSDLAGYYPDLVMGIVTASWAATVAFAYLFLQSRWSYYGVMRRLMRIELSLRVGSDDFWGYAPYGGKFELGCGGSLAQWKSNTQILSSFLTRAAYVFGGNLAVSCIGVLLMVDGAPADGYAWMAMFLAATLYWVGYFAMLDYRHFARASV